jgi:hypothetical protein
MKKIVAVTLDVENVEKLKKISKEENIPISTIVDGLIEQFILNREVKKNELLGKSS